MLTNKTQNPKVEMLTSIGQFKYSTFHDSELRSLFNSLKILSPVNNADSILPQVFALFDEVLNRRLGKWKIFNPEFRSKYFSKHSDIAEYILENDLHRLSQGYSGKSDLVEFETCAQMLESYFSMIGLDSSEIVIVTAIVYVSEIRKFNKEWQINLPSSFYQSIALKDIDDELSFCITEEQFMAGRLMFNNCVVQMNAGEGKTISCALAATLNATLGKNVHVITSNDYLALRDANWLAPVYEFLGFNVKVILNHMIDAERQNAYAAEIVYATIREIGFDFLRDNLRFSKKDMVQASFDVAIVDEADQVMIDEASTPLIISNNRNNRKRSVTRIGNTIKDMVSRQETIISKSLSDVQTMPLSKSERHNMMAHVYLGNPTHPVIVQLFSINIRDRKKLISLADTMKTNELDGNSKSKLYFFVDVRNDRVTLTDTGYNFLQTRLKNTIFSQAYGDNAFPFSHDAKTDLSSNRQNSITFGRQAYKQGRQLNLVYQMLRAHILLKKDIDYIVINNSITLVDEFTGRILPYSKYQNGLQNALEAKENIPISPETIVDAQISVQGMLRQYLKLSGITGTARSSAGEFEYIYNLEVHTIAPTVPSLRKDHLSRVYTCHKDKLFAILDQIKFCQLVGRPVIVATQHIDQSNEISNLLNQHNIKHSILNAVNESEEARIIRSAGTLSAVTVATNMAGRGTDIVLQIDLDKKIVALYMKIVQEYLDEDSSSVVLSCSNLEDSLILENEISKHTRLEFVRLRENGNILIVVSDDNSVRDVPVNKREPTIEFGLGLYVIGTIMHNTVRVDRQLIGRSGRNGQFGCSRFILSLDDPILVKYASIETSDKEIRYDHRGHIFYEGEKIQNRLSKIQKTITTDNEIRRSVIWEYFQIMEQKTMTYYKFRNSVIRESNFYSYCAKMLPALSDRIVSKHSNIQYHQFFKNISEELWLDYQIDIRTLDGLDMDKIAHEMNTVMSTRLRSLRKIIGAKKFERISKLLFLKTSDSIWNEQINKLQDQMMSTQLSGNSHNSALTQYWYQTREIVTETQDEMVDVFLPKLFDIQSTNKNIPYTTQDDLIEDVKEILV